MTPLASLLRHHGIAYHLYADDTQLFEEFSLTDDASPETDDASPETDNASPETAIAKMEFCVASIRHWMKITRLKHTDDKTEFLFIHPKSANQQVLLDCVTVDNARQKPGSNLRLHKCPSNDT